MKHLFTTDGRVSRSTFWNFNVGLFLLTGLLGVVLDSTILPEWLHTVVVLCVFPMLLLSIIVQIKRWHDLDKSGWWVFINLIPFAGGLWTLIECGCCRGTQGMNRFGPDPLAPPPPPLPAL
jgi:uncharacterized membrane protein YhaH (DUF805 family)